MTPIRSFSVVTIEVAVVALLGCSKEAAVPPSTKVVSIRFDVELNSQIYADSAWADPPQLAIWIENAMDRSVKTVMVTRRTARCDWEGKVDCQVALPYWARFYNRETGTNGPPTWDQPVVDAVTRPTPKESITSRIEVLAGSRWEYFIEVNVSGDFNSDFQRLSDAGKSDRYGNGQPSLVYQGTIKATDGTLSHPVLIGRTDQYELADHIIEDTSGVTTAKELIQSIVASCQEVGN